MTKIRSGAAEVSGKPLVSVVIPVWNAEKNIKKLIEELLGQSYRNVEIIAVDDGSSDDSLQVLRGLAKTDERLKVIHQENGGVGAARNRGIEAATGEYLVFVDSDDEVETDFVKALVEAVRRDPAVVLAVAGRKYNKLQEQKTGDAFVQERRAQGRHERLSQYVIYLMIFDGRMYGMTGKIFRAETIRRHEIRVDEGRNFAEDTKFVIDYLAARSGKIICIPKALYIYNFGTETSIVQKSSTVWANWEQSYRELEAWARSENGGKLGLKTRMLLWIVRLRWHVSHYKAKKRARKARV